MIVKNKKNQSIRLFEVKDGTVFKSLDDDILRTSVHYIKTDIEKDSERLIGVTCLEDGNYTLVNSDLAVQDYPDSEVQIK